MIVREATINDWDELLVFFNKIYRKNHPLQTKEFWVWQFGDVNQGRSFICENKSGTIVGHVGANFKENLAWIINVYLDVDYRGKGVLGKLYALAREYYPLAATAANDAGLGLYRNMRWYRYMDLQRFVIVNPIIENPKTSNVCKETKVSISNLKYSDTHFFKQPFIDGVKLSDNSTAISQENVGGLRIVDLNDVAKVEAEAWKLGYLWIDYITSWNDLKIKELQKRNWKIDYENVVPWRLNPIEENYFCDITFLSEEPIDKEFVVHRSFSDHGRIGSIIKK